ncbi:MAG: spore coat U domain-containing protein [Rickettsiella sp.]|nr:spore coat U domain-containing protein [Rickettsiella sp.]
MRFFGQLEKKPSLRRLFFYIFFCTIYFSYSLPVYAACSGLGCACAVSPAPTAVAFGNYNPISGTATTANGNIAVTCSALVIYSASYVISLNAGNSGSFATRFMNLSGNHLNYNLYTTTARTTIWGDGTAGTSTINDSYTSIGLSTTRNYTVYGLLPALQALPVGTYTDTITVTVTY